MIVQLAYVMLILGLGPAALYVLGKLKDPLHPLIVVGAASFFVSAQSLLTASEPAAELLGTETFVRYLGVSIVSLLGFYLGWKVSHGRDLKRFTDAHIWKLPRDGTLVAIAAICAIVANLTFVLVYGQAFVSGYLRDWQNLWITAAILMMQMISPAASRFHTYTHTLRASWYWRSHSIPPYFPLVFNLRPTLSDTIWNRPHRFDFLSDTEDQTVEANVYLLCGEWRSGLVLAVLWLQRRSIIKEGPGAARNRFTAQYAGHSWALPGRGRQQKYEAVRSSCSGRCEVQSDAMTRAIMNGKGRSGLRLRSAASMPKEFFADKWAWFGDVDSP